MWTLCSDHGGLVLEGKVALVTGASSGLGKHFARVLSRNGASVVLAARRREKLDSLADELSKNSSVLSIKMDVTSGESIVRGLDAVFERFGKLDIVINNAGVAIPSRITDSSLDDWDKVMKTNAQSVWFLMKECAHFMRKGRDGGSIVNIASILGMQPGVGHGLYGASKAAIIHLTKNAAIELWDYGIRVNALSPGYFLTEMNEEYFNSVNGRRYLEEIPPKRLGQVDELSVPLLMLVSDAGSFINGAVIPVDGGHSCQSL